MIWLLSAAALAVLPWLARRRWAQGRYVQARTRAHQATLDALYLWLSSPEVREALYRSGWTKPRYLVLFRHRMGRLTYDQLQSSMDALLQDRHVRQQVAKLMAREGLSEKRETMRALSPEES